MEKAQLAVLRAEIETQLKEIKEIYARIEERRKKKDQITIESLGYQLHNLYCAFEDLFEIVARTFENQIENKSRYHSELLKRMAISIEGVRPALISKESYPLLDNLRAFRHFFRHAYTQSLDERRLAIVLEDALRLKDLYEKEAAGFLNLLGNTESAKKKSAGKEKGPK